eukprot:SAG31_NODE_26961_length_433_cov_1.317365_1_plen_20_part_10
MDKMNVHEETEKVTVDRIRT